MKKLLKLVLLVGLFISFSSSEASSQTITNNSDCDMEVVVFHDCSGTTTYSVDSGDVETMSDKALAAQGTAIQLSLGPCGFRISDGTCMPGSTMNTASCPGSICDTYTGSLDANGNITITN